MIGQSFILPLELVSLLGELGHLFQGGLLFIFDGVGKLVQLRYGGIDSIHLK